MAFEGIWIEGTDLHVIDSTDGSEWKYTGTYVSRPANAIPGSIWIESGDLHYIDANGDKRKIPSVVMGTASGIVGSAWKSGRFLSFIDEMNQIKQTHTDVPYSNRAGEYTPHSDNYAEPSHTNYDSHSNYYYTSHGDSGSYNNNYFPYTDHYYPHTDNYISSNHVDNYNHNDYFGNNAPHSNNSTHSNNYYPPYYSNFAESHTNVSASHTDNDTHSNYTSNPYSDSGAYYDNYFPGSHGNIAHADSPHYDIPYGDSPVKVS